MSLDDKSLLNFIQTMKFHNRLHACVESVDFNLICPKNGGCTVLFNIFFLGLFCFDVKTLLNTYYFIRK